VVSPPDVPLLSSISKSSGAPRNELYEHWNAFIPELDEIILMKSLIQTQTSIVSSTKVV